MKWELLGELPHTLKIENDCYPIASDFRVSINFFELMLSDIPDDEKWKDALELYFGGIPVQYENALEAMVYFYSCGDSENGEKGTSKKEKLVLHYIKDKPFIYSAFLDQYGIDLYSVDYLHWWKFNALFKGLKKDSRIIEIIGYRSAEEESWMSSDQKKEIRRLHKIWDIDMRSDADKKADEEFLKMLMTTGDITSYLKGGEQ